MRTAKSAYLEKGEKERKLNGKINKRRKLCSSSITELELELDLVYLAD